MYVYIYIFVYYMKCIVVELHLEKSIFTGMHLECGDS